ncbi:hypothetical protein ACT4Y9_18500 [Acinetobacter baumannii]
MDKCREEFEKAFPVPAHWIEYDEKSNRYYCPYVADATASTYQSKWVVWQHLQAKVEELQKRVDEITNIATELAEYASYAEIVGGVTVNRSAVRSFCDKVFDFNRKVDQELEQALKGEG